MKVKVNERTFKMVNQHANNKIIIMEGADVTGKSEIGSALANQFGLAYFKNLAEHQSFSDLTFSQTAFVEANYLLCLLKQVEIKENGIVLDRHIPSEYVYSKVFERETNEDEIWEIDRQLAELGAVIVYCYKDEYKDFDDEVIKFERIEQLKDTYQEYFNKTNMPVLQLNTTDENLERELNEIIPFLKDKEIV